MASRKGPGLAGKLLLLLAIAFAVSAADAHRSRGRQLLQEFKKEEKYTPAEKPSSKVESKTTGEWSVKKTTEVKQQGKPSSKVEVKEPKQKYESKSTSEFKGPEKAKGPTKTTDKDGNKVFTYSSGKRAWEYTHTTEHKVNFPSKEVTISGGSPLVVTHNTVVTAPIKETNIQVKSGDGPKYESKWSYKSGTAHDKGH